MSDSNQTSKVLYLVVCAAPPSQRIQELITIAKDKDWDVCIFATPEGVNFIDIPLLEELSNHSVRSKFKRHGTPDKFPKGDAMIVAPATFNTTNKLAQGIADNLALSQMVKALGLKQPLIIAPCISGPFSKHPAFQKNINFLKKAGVRVLYDPQKYPGPYIVPWETIMDELEKMTSKDMNVKKKQAGQSINKEDY